MSSELLTGVSVDEWHEIQRHPLDHAGGDAKCVLSADDIYKCNYKTFRSISVNETENPSVLAAQKFRISYGAYCNRVFMYYDKMYNEMVK